ncbi:MAG TPA: hypothetical protein VGQ04_00290 [Chitinophagaceae bacterium]|jgi:hypothetical protein|nr:hypothetical protein [Chitinophagaceae bacterium]
MKKNQTIAVYLAALLTFIFLINACSKKTEPTPTTELTKKEAKKETDKKKPLTSIGEDPAASILSITVDTCGSCGNYFSATHSGTGFYVYPDIPLDLHCAVQSTTVTLGCVYYDVPNRYTVYDKNGSVVVTTGWIGWAHCSGPWGASVTTANYETFMTFTYSSSLAPYKLRVETNVIGCTGPGCSSDPGCTDNDDNWQVHVSCITNSGQPDGDACGSCSTYFSNTHAGTGYYLYPDITLDLHCAVTNTNVTVGCTYYDVPNRFTIYDKNGIVATTNWIGWAHCTGPWGFSVTTAQAETFISFNYDPNQAPYKLRVETTVIGCTGSCSNDPGCRDNDDNWQAHVMCITQ